jgi:hypothetical protein
MSMASGKHCFIIMPFSKTKGKHTAKYWDDFFFNFIKPAVENLEHTCTPSDDFTAGTYLAKLTIINTSLPFFVLCE